MPAFLNRLRNRLRSTLAPVPDIPAELWLETLRRHPFLAALGLPQQAKLRALSALFLDGKQFHGAHGLVVTDAMAIDIAAQACLPLLGDARGFYPRLSQVLLYPGAFFVDRVAQAGGGVQRDERRLLSGESWSQGQVVLSWQDVLEGAADPEDGRNVVIHEFAHQLDQIKGHANGAPPLRDRATYARWSRVMQAEYQALLERAARGEPSLLSDYGATDPAEFFAVASEVFFEQPLQLAAAHPALYRELSAYYRVHPFSW